MAFGGGGSGPSPIQEAVVNHRNSVPTAYGTLTNTDAKNLARRKLLKDTYGDDFENNKQYQQQRTLLGGGDPEQEDKNKATNNGNGSGAGGVSLGGGL